MRYAIFLKEINLSIFSFFSYLRNLNNVQIPVKIQSRLLIMEPATGVASIEYVQCIRKGDA